MTSLHEFKKVNSDKQLFLNNGEMKGVKKNIKENYLSVRQWKIVKLLKVSEDGNCYNRPHFLKVQSLCFYHHV